MASTYSPNLAIQLMGTGDQAGTWGATTNLNLGTLVEQAISGYVEQAITDGADTSIDIPPGQSGVARNMYIKLTGALTASRNLVVPLNKKLYFIHNATTGGFGVTVRTSGGGVLVAMDAKVALVCNGSVITEALSTAVTTAGGTNTQIQYNNSGAFAGASLTYNSATGGYSFPAPTSGTVITVNGLSANTVRDFNIVRTVSTDAIQNAPNITFTDGTAANEWTLQAGAGIFSFWNFNGSAWVKRLSINNSGNVVVSTPVSGVAVLVNSFAGEDGIRILAPASNNATIRLSGNNAASSNSALIYQSSVGTLWLTNQDTTNGINLSANGATRLSIASTGNTTFSGAAVTTPINVGTITTTLTINCQQSNVFYTTLTAATNVTTVTLNNPTDGQTINIFVTQSTGSPYFASTMVGTWAKWPGGVAGTLTSSSGAVDLIVATYQNSSWYATISKGFA